MANLSEIKVCRFCLESNEQKLEDIFDKPIENVPLSMQVLSCVSIEIFDGDEMPRYCCVSCRKLLEVMYHYKQICRKSDIALRQCLITGTGRIPVKFEVPVLVKNVSVQTEDTEEFIEEMQTYAESYTVSNSADALDLVIKPSTKRRKVVEKESESQIEIVELTQSELHNLQKVFTTVTENVTTCADIVLDDDSYRESFLLNNGLDEQKGSYEFQKFVMNEQDDVEVEILERTEETADATIFPCSFCPRAFPIKQQLELHIDIHYKERNYVCDMCQNKFLSKNDLAKHVLTHTKEKEHTCSVCKRSFARYGILKRHHLQHKEHFIYICGNCPEKFVSEAELKKHVEYVHTKSRPFPCQHCDKSFAFKQGLERHMIQHDLSRNLHVCEICDESFPTLMKLQQHLPKHVGKRRYLCKYCAKSFILSHHLSRHIRNAHTNRKISKKTKHVCTLCKQLFQNRESLIKHSVEHVAKSLVCPLCKRKFESLEQVDAHIEQHALALQHYSCDTCNTSYLIEDELNQHFEDEHNYSEEV